MSNQSSTSTHPHSPEPCIFGFTTDRSARLWVARLDGPEDVAVRQVRHWKLGVVGVLVLLWLLASLLQYLAA